MRTLLILFAGGALLALAACGPFYPDETRIVSRGWAKPELHKDEGPLYCYRTLALVDCHTAPLRASESGRIVNAYPAPPEKPAAKSSDNKGGDAG